MINKQKTPLITGGVFLLSVEFSTCYCFFSSLLLISPWNEIDCLLKSFTIRRDVPFSHMSKVKVTGRSRSKIVTLAIQLPRFFPGA